MSNISVRKATPADLDALCAFYDAVIDDMDPGQPGPKWTKGVYPTIDDLASAVEADTFYLAFNASDGNLVGAYVLNRTDDEVYDNHSFSSGINHADTMVVHLLAVHSQQRGKGYARAMMESIAEEARAQGAEAVRLDILVENTPAACLYEACGYANEGNVTMFYEDIGWTECTLYELVL